MHGAIVSGQINDKSPPHTLSDTTMFIEQHKVKKVARMLTVQGCHQLTGVKFIDIEHWNLKLPLK